MRCEPFWEGLFLIRSKIELNKLTLIFVTLLFDGISAILMKHRHHINHSRVDFKGRFAKVKLRGSEFKRKRRENKFHAD